MRAKYLLLFAIVFLFFYYLTFHSQKPFKEVKVVRVIDGDTIVLEGGAKVRLKGINAAERGQRCFDKARDLLKGLVEGKIVKIKEVGRDRYGRILGYIFVNNTFVNQYLIEKGLAYEWEDPKSPYFKIFSYIENQTIGGCLFEKSPHFGCLKIKRFEYDAEGDDCKGGEILELSNICETLNLSGWYIKDKANHLFYLKGILYPNTSLTLISGCNVSGGMPLCLKEGCKAVWNNNHDGLYIYDNDGKLVLRYTYP